FSSQHPVLVLLTVRPVDSGVYQGKSLRRERRLDGVVRIDDAGRIGEQASEVDIPSSWSLSLSQQIEVGHVDAGECQEKITRAINGRVVWCDPVRILDG